MLFDLRGRGRRRKIQAIYLTLAILLGGGLVLFGIGGETSGGLLDAVGLTDQGGGGGANDPFAKRAERAQKRLQANPNDAAALAELARARFQQAGLGENYDQNQETFTPKGKQKLGQAGEAWERYLALKPAKPDDGLASFMVQAYGPDGLNQPDKAATAAEVVSLARPSFNTFRDLAFFAYLAKQTRKGDLAAAEAIRRSPPNQRATVKSQLEQAKKQAAGAGTAGAAGAAGGAAGAGGAPPPTGSATGE